MNIFAADFLEQKGMFDFEGAGIIIAIKSGTKDTRKKPYNCLLYTSPSPRDTR